MAKRILLITNGHGEDRVAAEIIKRLPRDFEAIKLSLVSEKLPSGGFSLRNWRFLAKDIAAGLIGHTAGNIAALREMKGKLDLTIAVGDIAPIIGALLAGAPFIFVGVNKSDYYQSFGSRYTPWEKWLLKKYARKIYVRDALTAKNLNREGIPAEYAGNPLMDCVGKITNVKLPMSNEGNIIIGLLPGTREDARLNMEDFEKVIEELLALKDADTAFQFLIATKLAEIPEYMEKKSFEEVLSESALIVGLSGTGNEQAAGFGKPVVSFYGKGSQYNRKFAQAQKELLGDALTLVRTTDHRAVAAAVWRLLKDPLCMVKLGRAGKERMGSAGAIEKICQPLIN